MFKSPIDQIGGITLAFKKLPRGVFELLQALAVQLTELEIQRDRIKNNSRILFSKSNLGLDESEQIYYTLLTDAHFYIIAWANVHKVLQRVSALMKDPKLERILQRRHKWFEQVRQARNSFEHLDERLTKSGSARYQLIHLAGYTTPSIFVCGIRINVSESGFKRIDTLIAEINKWASQLPERFSS